MAIETGGRVASYIMATPFIEQNFNEHLNAQNHVRRSCDAFTLLQNSNAV